MNSLRIIIADDYPLFREGLEQALMRLLPSATITLVSTGDQVFELLEKETIHLIFLDIRMHGQDGIDLIRRIRQINQLVKVVAVTMMDDMATVEKIFEAGADGYLHKNTEKCMLQRIIEVVFNGDVYMSKVADKLKKDVVINRGSANGDGVYHTLSEREIEILILICKQHSSKEIATQLHLTEKTVETHRNHLMWKTQSKNVVGLTMYAIEKGYFLPEYRKRV